MSNSRDLNQESASDRNITRTHMSTEQENSGAENARRLIKYLYEWGETMDLLY
jgi:hypothetical protein